MSAPFDSSQGPTLRPVSRGLGQLQRRELLRRALGAAGWGATAPWALQMAALGEAAAASAPLADADDYRALVCVFLLGGNDHANTVVPCDADNHAAYAALRPQLALPLARLQALRPRVPLSSGVQLALAPALGGLPALFEAGRLGVLLNVGPLLAPTTLAQYQAHSVPLPPKLFSHNDQQSLWQSGLAEGAGTGWGGRLGDLMLSGNPGSTFSCMNAAGNAVFMTGRQAAQYQVSAAGPVRLRASQGQAFGSAAVARALLSLTQAASPHALEDEHARIMRRAVAAEAQLSQALDAAPVLTTPFDAANPLAAQLHMVARTVAARRALGVRRQVFLVALGGFDLHDNLAARHPVLQAQLADALLSLDTALQELGVAPQVTTFTASDFGRTLSANGDGTDHGWGSHHVVMGGAVAGGRFWGRAPATAVNGPDDVGRGRLLPSTSVDQLGAELALWMGVSPSDLPLVFPQVSRFDVGQLGLMRA